ncbi:chaperone modulator CbpM [Flavihumibacter petaseus]|uniref:MerR family transcriptional regulator n=1 Tax=Flavihumibacter petaseus NBRC 106054 TaxID=1220578 RepID=A0A0E9MV72_9BACT|nr:chaperone modulator CbpM [Flavihumibacter petaseus]GAO41025.1 hypothetical protein FPE01S_01_00370 [Flavihumibacter petaseus NBRC 106054]
MDERELIEIETFCINYQVEPSFLESLANAGLLELVHEETHHYFPANQVPDLEKMIRFHYDMDINLEGIEVIQHLLSQLKQMQQEKQLLQHRLSIYEWH